ncbi:uncharacterized protein LOC100375476 isoform X2 [Saccoglossus kowalevskii]|uniref:Uncharacterized protein LOC100375476 isoform X2 n=1 Tax=Saccoglossus kowalevskii TaxID=10224 RepID=A0ABM0MDH2_SACKO|nr:PREDICTED: uncharacterized protein LOC100375476 isoform X2 [Saccoglossus kowalevskii]
MFSKLFSWWGGGKSEAAAGESNVLDDEGSTGTREGSTAMRLTISSFKKKFPTVKCVKTDVVQTWLQEGSASTKVGDIIEKRPLVVVDSRPDSEYQVSHIPGAIRIDYTTDHMDDVVQQIKKSVDEESKDLTKTVVLYCSLGYRSCVLAEKVMKACQDSDLDVYNMEGGLFKWANEGAPMENGSGRLTKYAHPYNYVFGKLLHHSLRKETPENMEK